MPARRGLAVLPKVLVKAIAAMGGRKSKRTTKTSAKSHKTGFAAMSKTAVKAMAAKGGRKSRR